MPCCFKVVEETQVLMRKIVKQVATSKLSYILLPIQGRLQFHIAQFVIQHVETYDEENMRDFVDVYLREIASSKDPSFNGKLLLKTLSIPVKKIDKVT